MVKIATSFLLLWLPLAAQAALIKQHQLLETSCFDFLKPVKEYFNPNMELGPRAFPPDLHQESGEVYPAFELVSKYVGENRLGIVGGSNDLFKSVRYLSEEDRRAYRIYMSEGLFVNHEGFAICPERLCSGILVMDVNSRIYFSTLPELGKFHHSSFVGGGPVTFSGEAVFQDGRLLKVNNVSGHYLPTVKAIKSLILELERFSVQDYQIGVLAKGQEWGSKESIFSLRKKLIYLPAHSIRKFIKKNPAHLGSEILYEEDILDEP